MCGVHFHGLKYFLDESKKYLKKMFIELEVCESEQGKGKIIALCTTLDSWDYFFPLVWKFACNIFN